MRPELTFTPSSPSLLLSIRVCGSYNTRNRRLRSRSSALVIARSHTALLQEETRRVRPVCVEDGLHVESQRRSRARRPGLYQAGETPPADHCRTVGLRKDLRWGSRARGQSECFPLICWR